MDTDVFLHDDLFVDQFHFVAHSIFKKKPLCVLQRGVFSGELSYTYLKTALLHLKSVAQQ